MSVDKILKFKRAYESNEAATSFGTVYYTVKSGSNVCVVGQNPKQHSAVYYVLKSEYKFIMKVCGQNTKL